MEAREKMGDKLRRFPADIMPSAVAAVLVIADITAILTAIAISLLLRFDGMPMETVYHRYVQTHLLSLHIGIVIYIAVFSMCRMYKHVWRFVGLDMLWTATYASGIGLAGFILAQYVIDGHVLPRSVIVILWITSAILVGGVRILLRVLCIAKHSRKSLLPAIRRDAQLKRVIILGAGANGARVLRSTREDPELNYDVIGFLDDDPKKIGTYLSNIKVIGPVNHLKHLMTCGKIDEVVVALPASCGKKIREFVLDCRKHKLPVKVVPQIRDALAEEKHLQLVDFSVEDLLRRPPADTDMAEIGSYLTGKRVLITGAGGSIGSELVRQVASLNPATLILLGHGENSIHQIYQELKNSFPHLRDRLHCVIASVAHECQILNVFDYYRPQVVFHAAAHKHVPIMETNERESIFNNVLGTNNIAEACGRFGVLRIVSISTDKAADPCSIMGATKWLCEEVLRAAASKWAKTSYITVRFGNVLGSRGSVVPIFLEQMKRGGPVTVTHPEMTRYFMTIPEAVRLVLQSGAVGKSGNLYLLDMGDPIKIKDLAEDMIRLCSLEPGTDIKIEYTGVRPGERLNEQLISGAESLKDTPWDRLSLVQRPNYFTQSEINNITLRLEEAANYGSAEDVRSILQDVVPGHCSLGTEVEELNPAQWI